MLKYCISIAQTFEQTKQENQSVDQSDDPLYLNLLSECCTGSWEIIMIYTLLEKLASKMNKYPRTFSASCT